MAITNSTKQSTALYLECRSAKTLKHRRRCTRVVTCSLLFHLSLYPPSFALHISYFSLQVTSHFLMLSQVIIVTLIHLNSTKSDVIAIGKASLISSKPIGELLFICLCCIYVFIKVALTVYLDI